MKSTSQIKQLNLDQSKPSQGLNQVKMKQSHKSDKRAMRCTECGKILRSHLNKSGLCSYHYMVYYQRNNKDKLLSKSSRIDIYSYYSTILL
jgi:hypothetical protein